MTLRFTCLLLAFGVIASVRADTILLRDGRRVEGTVIGQDRTRIRIRSAGRVQVIDKASVRRVLYGREADLEKRAFFDRQRRDEAARRKAEDARKAEAARKGQDPQTKRERPIPRVRRQGDDMGALWRSAALPGWGLIHKDRGVLGYAYGGAFVAGALFWRSARAHAIHDRDAYRQGTFLSTAWTVYLRAPELALVSSELDRESRETYQRSLSRTSRALGFVGFLYAGQILHAFLAEPGPLGATGTGARAGMDWSVSWEPAVSPLRGGAAESYFRLELVLSF